MKITKWIAASALCASSAFAAGAQLDIVVRDFSVEHPDFENFSEEFIQHSTQIVAYGKYGFDAAWSDRANLHSTCGNMTSRYGAQIGTDGNPITPSPMLPDYLQMAQKSASTQPLKYGDCAENSHHRGYTNASSTRASMTGSASCTGGQFTWANPVYYTPGMVQSYLSFDRVKNEAGEYDMYDGVHIRKAADLCDNGNFDQWYEDVPGTNFRINKTLDLDAVQGEKGIYVADYNYNNGGYSPLDTVDAMGNYVGRPGCNSQVQVKGFNNEPINPKCEQFGPQSFSIFCPPYGYEYADKQEDKDGLNTFGLCTSWLGSGGPKDPGAAERAKGAQGGLKHLRNYAFTMMGYAKFKYKAENQATGGEVFEFVGDDDMWIFVDGVLVVDLGGTHLAAPGAVNIKTLADHNHGCNEGEPLADYSNCNKPNGEAGWGEGTWHHLHFFYADRQTDGSNMLIRTSLAELAPSKYGQPALNQVLSTIENGVSVAKTYVNTELDPSTLAAINAQGAAYPILQEGQTIDPNAAKFTMVVKRGNAVYGFLAYSVSEGENMGVDGFKYEIKGVLVDESGKVVGPMLYGDEIAFNFNATPEVGASMDEYYPWLNNGHAIDITSKSGKPVEGYPNNGEWASVELTLNQQAKIIAQDNKIDRPDFENANKVTDVAGGDELPLDATGELKLVPVPLDYGGDPTIDPYAIDANVQKSLFNDGDVPRSYAKNAKLGGSANLAPVAGGAGLCAEGENNPCISFNYIMVQPFRVNIRVFDHLGHFVSQYNKTMTEEQFRAALGEPALTDPNKQHCNGKDAVTKAEVKADLHGTGALLVSMSLYPVSQTGRKLATGPYIYQVTIINEPFATGTCVVMSHQPVYYRGFYTRVTETFTRGYRRLKKK